MFILKEGMTVKYNNLTYTAITKPFGDSKNIFVTGFKNPPHAYKNRIELYKSMKEQIAPDLDFDPSKGTYQWITLPGIILILRTESVGQASQNIIEQICYTGEKVTEETLLALHYMDTRFYNIKRNHIFYDIFKKNGFENIISNRGFKGWGALTEYFPKTIQFRIELAKKESVKLFDNCHITGYYDSNNNYVATFRRHTRCNDAQIKSWLLLNYSLESFELTDKNHPYGITEGLRIVE